MRSARASRWLLASVCALSCTPRGAAVPATAGDATSASASGSGAAPSGGNLLKSSSFDDGVSVPWTTAFTAPADGAAEVENGALCVTVTNKGKDNWDAQFRHREMVIQRGHTYTVQFKGWASAATRARPKVGMSGPPYAEYWNATIELDPEPKLYKGAFTMGQADDATAEFAFHIGGSMARADLPFKVCIDDVRLDDPEFTPGASSASAGPAPKLLVNQLGYLPGAAKVATLVTSATAPLDWELLDSAGKAVAQGKTTPFGKDAASGEAVQIVDFSSFKTAGQGYRLKVGADQSFPFDIGTGIYSQLKYDALSYFYQTRSGVEIRADLVQNPALARPAGPSDKSVKCGKSAGCDYSLDVSGGWYDAGDHGKYVVNGGISLWTLLNQAERAIALGTSFADFGDGKLRIPEAGNQVPDLLDEARWELEFLLKMQVPAGKPLAGMVHHKMHDVDWTALGVAPHEDKQPRVLFKPSTAATLNLAATAAQASRLWRKVDAAFSTKCLQAAEVAWAAARANPKLFADKEIKGGGAYDDNKVDDDFYWAAAELLVTTAKPEYKRFVEASPHGKRLRMDAGGHTSSMNWADTDALGSISLAVGQGVDPALQAAARKQLTFGADEYLKIIAAQGFRTPLKPNAAGQYIWGSNSFVINNLIVLALAYDFTKQQKYLDGVATGMDYLLGRNPLGQSYVTGYGEKPLQNPHHRFWAHQANAKYPSAPPGILSGGPNSSIDDPYAKAAGLKGCAPEKCFVDHIEAYSVNEITINWNAPLAWVSAWLDEKARSN
ncbi:MAG TPA: glycoside hydrolase family 9 protein [Polyangiaceae bacterium]|nr:glycoside hydrolase family 9 protein [Polyangiaceae bacterium]